MIHLLKLTTYCSLLLLLVACGSDTGTVNNTNNKSMSLNFTAITFSGHNNENTDILINGQTDEDASPSKYSVRLNMDDKELAVDPGADGGVVDYKVTTVTSDESGNKKTDEIEIRVNSKPLEVP